MQQQPHEYLSHLFNLGRSKAGDGPRRLEEEEAETKSKKAWKRAVFFQSRRKVCGIGVEVLVSLAMRAPSAVAHGKDSVALYRCGRQGHSQQ